MRKGKEYEIIGKNIEMVKRDPETGKLTPRENATPEVIKAIETINNRYDN